MDTTALETYLHEHIPLSKAMSVSVVTASFDAVALAAPLAPNINADEEVCGRIVIQSNAVKYERPMSGAFTATAFGPDADAWGKLLRALKRARMARIGVRANLAQDGERAGQFIGDFVVLPASG